MLEVVHHGNNQLDVAKTGLPDAEVIFPVGKLELRQNRQALLATGIFIVASTMGRNQIQPGEVLLKFNSNEPSLILKVVSSKAEADTTRRYLSALNPDQTYIIKTCSRVLLPVRQHVQAGVSPVSVIGTHQSAKIINYST